MRPYKSLTHFSIDRPRAQPAAMILEVLSLVGSAALNITDSNAALPASQSRDVWLHWLTASSGS